MGWCRRRERDRGSQLCVDRSAHSLSVGRWECAWLSASSLTALDRCDRCTAARVEAWSSMPPRRFLRSSPLGTAAAVLLVIIVLVAIFASHRAIRPAPQRLQRRRASRPPPQHCARHGQSRARCAHADHVWLAGESAGQCRVRGARRLGRHALGRDQRLSRVARYDMLSQRLIEVLTSFPTLILAMLLSVSLAARACGRSSSRWASPRFRSRRGSRARSCSRSRKRSSSKRREASARSPWRIMLRHDRPAVRRADAGHCHPQSR